MDALTAEIGLSLSAEARIWWGWHDGVDLEAAAPPTLFLGSGWETFSLALAVQDVIGKRQYAQASPDFPNSAWPDSWITLCGLASYPRIACDCAVPGGAPSTVHYFDPADNMEPLRPKLGSIGELVHAWLEAIDDGTWRIDADTGTFALLAPTELEAKGDDLGDLL
jgi:hypothetical protein